MPKRRQRFRRLGIISPGTPFCANRSQRPCGTAVNTISYENERSHCYIDKSNAFTP